MNFIPTLHLSIYVPYLRGNWVMYWQLFKHMISKARALPICLQLLWWAFVVSCLWCCFITPLQVFQPFLQLYVPLCNKEFSRLPFHLVTCPNQGIRGMWHSLHNHKIRVIHSGRYKKKGPLNANVVLDQVCMFVAVGTHWMLFVCKNFSLHTSP